jgi:hypothetical protein
VGEKLPQAPLLPHVTVHLTPPLLLSFVTTAVMLVVAPTNIEAGGCALKATEMTAAAVMVIVADAVFVVSVTEVAVTVTVAGLGGAEGAV